MPLSISSPRPSVWLASPSSYFTAIHWKALERLGRRRPARQRHRERVTIIRALKPERKLRAPFAPCWRGLQSNEAIVKFEAKVRKAGHAVVEQDWQATLYF